MIPTAPQIVILLKALAIAQLAASASYGIFYFRCILRENLEPVAAHFKKYIGFHMRWNRIDTLMLAWYIYLFYVWDLSLALIFQCVLLFGIAMFYAITKTNKERISDMDKHLADEQVKITQEGFLRSGRSRKSVAKTSIIAFFFFSYAFSNIPHIYFLLKTR